jgi:hypothetical protein
MPFPTYRNAILLACLAGTSVGYGQRLSYGLKAGGAITESGLFRADESKRYVVGGTIEVSLGRGFAAEADVLYRRNGFTTQFSYGPSLIPAGPGLFPDDSTLTITNRSRSSVLEIPVVGKYYFRHGRSTQPFVLTGYSFRKAHNSDEASFISSSGVGAPDKQKGSYWTPLDIGATVGAGINWRMGAIALGPELRYTHWGSSSQRNGLANRQTDALLGVRF